MLLDEAADLVERTPSLAHIVVDEAQDLSPMMLRALGRRSSTGSLTVLGDLAQATTPWATRSWAEALGHLGKPDAHVEQLTRGFRVPGEVIEYAARLLPHIAPGARPADLGAPQPRRAQPASRAPTVARRGPRPPCAAEGSVGLIVPDARLAEADARSPRSPRVGRSARDVPATSALETEFDAQLDLVPASLAKGLEFDHVVLLDPAASSRASPTGSPGCAASTSA